MNPRLRPTRQLRTQTTVLEPAETVAVRDMTQEVIRTLVVREAVTKTRLRPRQPPRRSWRNATRRGLRSFNTEDA